ncbi:protein kinase family protein [Nonomuraea sp. KM90]|uniref:protein kinase family protein n=1 Tax=Nonomuraea sp. KM90 TaxID=3457428 RepID=UPI003FCC4BFA
MSHEPSRSRQARLTSYAAVSTSLALLGDDELARLLDEAAVPLGAGIGGTSARLEVEGTPVFVKRLTLTDLERQPGNVRSTANLFGLPPFCQYGVGSIGSPGFGAWRELAAHTMTTDWVLADQFAGFPLMYHWRVLPHPAPALVEQLADVDRAVAYWGGGTEVRRRIEALRTSSVSLTLFLEHLPQNLHQWLNTQVEAGDEAAVRACAVVDRGLREGVSFMNSRGLMHFDTHFGNIMTDGRRLYFTDFGLATSSRFALSPEERDFLRLHRTYDETYAISYLVYWLVTALYQEERRELVRGWAGGGRPTGVPGEIAELLSRDSLLTTVMWDFYGKLRDESRKTPYPVEEVRRIAERPAAG